jgi:hypothetical protein
LTDRPGGRGLEHGRAAGEAGDLAAAAGKACWVR